LKRLHKSQTCLHRHSAVARALSAAAFGLACTECLAVNALQNPDFEIDLSYWTIAPSEPTPGIYVNHWPYGWNDSSGSLGLAAEPVNGNGNIVTAMQCINGPFGKVHASVEVFPFDAPEQSLVASHVLAYADQDCMPNTLLSILVLEPQAPVEINSWTTFDLHEDMPIGTASILLDVVVTTGSGLADYMIDHVYLDRGSDEILASGFEPID
jgi:hypothetical protein